MFHNHAVVHSGAAVLPDNTALRTLADRWAALDNEINDLDRQLNALVTRAAPKFCALHGVGTEIALQMLITAGDNHDRLNGEAAFARPICSP